MKKPIIILGWTLAACSAPAEPDRGIYGEVRTEPSVTLPGGALAHVELYRFVHGAMEYEAGVTVSATDGAFVFDFQLASGLDEPRFVTAWIDLDADGVFNPIKDLAADDGAETTVGDYLKLVARSQGPR